MKLAVVDFEVIERGGINRIIEGLRWGFESLGHEFDYFWASRKGITRNLSQDNPVMVNKRYFRLPAKRLAYKGDSAKLVWNKLVKKYDAVMFMLPCPHDIKGNVGDMSWTMLYEVAAENNKPIVVIIHDNLWDKYYPWYRQVSNLVDFHLFTCYQAKYDSLSRLPGHFLFLPTPLNVTDAGLYSSEKTEAICWMPQWKRWKGIYEFILAMPKIETPIDLYNAGIEYHKARKDPDAGWKNAIGLDHIARKRGRGPENHQYHGALLPDQIPRVYRTHTASIDLSGSIGDRFAGQTSCVMLESMLYGCISVVHNKVRKHPWSPLRGMPVTWPLPASDPDSIADTIKALLSNDTARKAITRNALDFVVDYSDARKHATMVLDKIGVFKAGRPRPKFWDNICSDPIPIHEDAVYDLRPYISKNTVRQPQEAEDIDGSAFETESTSDGLSISRYEESAVSGGIVPGTDQRLLRFITKVARAWVDVYGDLDA